MTVEVYKIERDIPVPKPLVGQLPLDRLEVGESFAFPLELRAKAQVMASQLKRRKDKEFTIRLVGVNECRVWRIG